MCVMCSWLDACSLATGILSCLLSGSDRAKSSCSTSCRPQSRRSMARSHIFGRETYLLFVVAGGVVLRLGTGNSWNFVIPWFCNFVFFEFCLSFARSCVSR